MQPVQYPQVNKQTFSSDEEMSFSSKKSSSGSDSDYESLTKKRRATVKKTGLTKINRVASTTTENLNGLATYISPSGAKFFGEWEKGVLKGEACIEFPDGTKVFGIWNDGWQGEARVHYSNKHVYQGLMREEKDKYLIREGYGLLYTPNANFRGNWINDRLPNGTIELKDGLIYEGEMQNFQPHGQGTLKSPDGSQIMGKWNQGKLVEILAKTQPDLNESQIMDEIDSILFEEDNLFYKRPTYTGIGKWINGNHTYEGMWNDTDFVSGTETIVTTQDIVTLTGDFKNFKLHGHCKRYSKTTELEIDGYWENGVLKHGKAITSTEEYNGEFKNNQYHGKGKYINKEGVAYDGEFVDGYMHGFGQLTIKNSEFLNQFGLTEVVTKGEFRLNNLYTGRGLLLSVKNPGLPKYGQVINGRLFTGIGYMRVEGGHFVGIIKEGKPYKGYEAKTGEKLKPYAEIFKEFFAEANSLLTNTYKVKLQRQDRKEKV